MAVCAVDTERGARCLTRLHVDVVDAFPPGDDAHHCNTIVTIQIQRSAHVAQAITPADIIIGSLRAFSPLEGSIEAGGLQLTCRVQGFHDLLELLVVLETHVVVGLGEE